MNQDQVAALLRTIVQVAGGFVIGKGWVDEQTALAVGGAIVTIGVTIWGLWARKNSNLVASAAAVPGVERVVSPKYADQIDSGKVVAR
jgi:hypothetical protein